MFGGRRFLALFLVAVSLLGACDDDGDPEPERATVPTAESTTTTTAATTTTAPPADFEALPADPALTPEEQVEAAYLHSWDIYLDAVGNGRTDYLGLVYGEAALETVTDEVEGLVADGHRAEGAPEHDYEITIAESGELAVVWDNYVNHLMLIDTATGEPLEDDPNSRSAYDFTLMLKDGTWLVVGIR